MRRHTQDAPGYTKGGNDRYLQQSPHDGTVRLGDNDRSMSNGSKGSQGSKIKSTIDPERLTLDAKINTAVQIHEDQQSDALDADNVKVVNNTE